MFSPESEENSEWIKSNLDDVQHQFEELKQKYHELNTRYQSKLSLEKDNLAEIEELRSCIENERQERKQEILKYEEGNKKKEIHWENEIEHLKAENKDNSKMFELRIEGLERELTEMKKVAGLEKDTIMEMKNQVIFLTETLELEESKKLKAEMAVKEQEKECIILKQKLADAEERLQIKEDEVEILKEKLESAVEEAVVYSSQLQAMKVPPQNEKPADPLNKGNSLFAEVEDCRQKMKHQLLYERKRFAKIQHTYQSKCNRVKHLEEELVEISRKWKDDLRESAVSKDNLIASFKNHIKDLEDKVERLKNRGLSVDSDFMVRMNPSPLVELKRIEEEMERSRKEIEELREKLSSASLERLLRDQDVFDLKSQLRRLRAENAYLLKVSEKNDTLTQEINTMGGHSSSCINSELSMED